GGGSPGGPTNAIQTNAGGGVFGGFADFTWDDVGRVLVANSSVTMTGPIQDVAVIGDLNTVNLDGSLGFIVNAAVIASNATKLVSGASGVGLIFVAADQESTVNDGVFNAAAIASFRTTMGGGFSAAVASRYSIVVGENNAAIASSSGTAQGNQGA